jgi:hypothetical protein
VPVTMAVIIRPVFGDTAGLVVGGVTVGGRTMAVGNGSPARFVGFAASLLDLDGTHARSALSETSLR